jgi:hypothetical protein
MSKSDAEKALIPKLKEMIDYNNAYGTNSYINYLFGRLMVGDTLSGNEIYGAVITYESFKKRKRLDDKKRRSELKFR